MEEEELKDIDNLKSEVDKLQKLLEDPQPGLSSWRFLFFDRLKEIASYLPESYKED